MECTDWDIVVVGFWNLAILSPAGIKSRLFELNDEDPVQVQVPMDGIERPRVIVDDIMVIAESSHLIVRPMQPTYASLEIARSVAARAIDNLPETPLHAAGFNLRWKSQPLAPTAFALFETPADDRLASDCHEIVRRGFNRQIRRGNGVINLSVEYDTDGEVRTMLNFHLDSRDRDQLTEWLRTDAEELRETCVSLVGALALEE